MRRLAARIAALFDRPRLDRQTESEIEAHLEFAAADLRANGLSDAEARAEARRRFGSVADTTEAVRDGWGFRVVDAVWRDLRFARRMLRRHPLFSASAIVTVALGVGANTGIASVLHTVLMRPLGLRHADAVMAVQARFTKLQGSQGNASGVEFRDVRSFTDTFAATAALEPRAWTWRLDGDASRLAGHAVTDDFFRVFDESPALGRFFVADDDPYSVVLSDSFWRARFGADPAVVGQTMMLDAHPYRIVGVAAAGFRFPLQAQIWTPLVLESARLQEAERARNRSLSLFVRLKPGLSAAQAADRLTRYVDGVVAADAARHGEFAANGYALELTEFSRYTAGDLRRPLLLLWSAAFLVLLVGCANIATLLLARAPARQREIAIRIAVGATRAQVVRQLLLESLLIGVLGGVAGLTLAAATVSLLARLTLPGFELLRIVVLDSRMVAYGLALAIVSGGIFGLAPAVQLMRQNHTVTRTGSRRSWTSGFVVAAQVGAAFVLLITSTLLLRSLWAIEQIDPGFDARGITSAFFIKPQGDPGFFDRVLAALRTGPDVEAVALANPIPFSPGGVTSGFAIRHRLETTGMVGQAEGFQVTPDYFETLRIPLMQGRGFTDSDRAGAPLVCVIDARLARQFFPGQDPVGQEISMFTGWARIVGVVGAVRGTTLEHDSRPAIYYPLAQIPFFPWAAVVVRSTRDAETLIRSAVREVNASVPVYDLRTLASRRDATLEIRGTLVAILSTFGGTSLLLAIVGLYGVTAQLVSERLRDIGVRIALGARRHQILVALMRQGLMAGLLGLAMGAVVIALARPWLMPMLYRVGVFDPTTLATVATGVLTMSLAAVWWPARGAAAVDPQQVLRHE